MLLTVKETIQNNYRIVNPFDATIFRVSCHNRSFDNSSYIKKNRAE